MKSSFGWCVSKWCRLKLKGIFLSSDGVNWLQQLSEFHCVLSLHVYCLIWFVQLFVQMASSMLCQSTILSHYLDKCLQTVSTTTQFSTRFLQFFWRKEQKTCVHWTDTAWVSPIRKQTHTHTHTHTTVLRLSWILFGTTQVSRHQKGKTRKINQSGFTSARDGEWQWHQLGHMQICTLTQTYNHTSIPPLSFLQTGCPSCCQTNSVKALKAYVRKQITVYEYVTATFLVLQ